MFRLMEPIISGSGEVAITAIVTEVNWKDHEDVHYLYRLRKALVLLVGEEGLHGLNEEQLKSLHEAIVSSMLSSGGSHYYSTYDGDLDEFLSEDLKKKSDGYYPPDNSSIFGLEDDKDEEIYKKLLEEHGAIALVEKWKAPSKRDKIPASHFLDQKNKRYPYKDEAGDVNCGGLRAAMSYSSGTRGVEKNPTVQAKAKRLLAANCNKED